MKWKNELVLCDYLLETGWARELQRLFQGANSGWITRRLLWPRNVPLQDLIRDFSPSLVFVFFQPEQAPEVMRLLRDSKEAVRPIIIVTQPGAMSLADFLRDGVVDFLLAPFREADVVPRVERWLSNPTEVERATASLSAEFGLRQFVGENKVFVNELRKLPRFARCDASVFIAGETGTGKEICARVLHHLSSRAHGPFVAVNSGAIPLDLVENELFGHESGAYTGAKGSQLGLVQEAEDGTLFLDEIDSLPLAAQVKLLRLLQEREYRALGSRKTRRANVRIIAASNMDAQEALRSGRLRQDLYYRLNVLRLRMPPLRERQEDIPLLARHFLGVHAAPGESAPREFSAAALEKLERHNWPGNIRELENIVERALLLSDDTVIWPDAVDLSGASDGEATRPQPFREVKARVVAQFEKDYLRELLLCNEGNVTAAARMAAKNRRAFFALMRKHHITVTTAKGNESGQVKVVIQADKNIRPRPRL